MPVRPIECLSAKTYGVMFSDTILHICAAHTSNYMTEISLHVT